MDNLAAHKVAGVREAIEAVGAQVLYLPPYSPDLNPIELVFAKFKGLIRSAAERTVDGLWNLCGQLLDRFTSTECHNYLRHCGYRYTQNATRLEPLFSFVRKTSYVILPCAGDEDASPRSPQMSAAVRD
jgi:transposase